MESTFKLIDDNAINLNVQKKYFWRRGKKRQILAKISSNWTNSRALVDPIHCECMRRGVENFP